MSRFEIHAHTHYSNLRLVDSINKPKMLINRAIELGLSGIAITDHDCLSAAPEVNAYQFDIAEEHPNFKIALGNEIYLMDNREKNPKYYHFILIARDKTGFRMLRELSSYAWLNSFHDRAMERVVTLKSELYDIVQKYGKGHLIATTACLGGELSTLTKALVDTEDYNLKVQIHSFIQFCLEIFGEDFYIECAPGRSQEQVQVNRRLLQIANAYDVKMVLGTDAHFLKKEDRYVHKAYLNSKDGEREVDDFYEFSYLQDEDEIIENLEPSNLNYEELVLNSEEIFNKIEVYSIQHKQQIPQVAVKDYPKKDFSDKWPTLKYLFSSNDVQDRYWVNKCFEALDKKNLHNDLYVDRLEEEADIKKTISEKLETNMFSYPVTL